MKTIKLLRGQKAKVSDRDFKSLSQFNWYLSTLGRVVRKSGNKTIYMSRQIKRGKVIDHKNNDLLDHTRRNLRPATNSQNQMNRTKSSNKSSVFKGVCWDKSRQKWVAHLKKNKTVLYLGRYTSEKKAAEAYNAAAVKHFKRFAKLNKLTGVSA